MNRFSYTLMRILRFDCWMHESWLEFALNLKDIWWLFNSI